MFVNISQLREKVENGLRLCGDSFDDCSAIVLKCEDRVDDIDQALRQVGLGSRVLTRSLEKFDEKQLVLLVSTLFDELQSSRELLVEILSQSLVNTIDTFNVLPNELLNPIILQSDLSMSIDERLAKIDSFVDNFGNFEQSCTELKTQISVLSDLKSALTSKPSSPPPPPIVDWTQIKFPPLPKVPLQSATIQSEVRLSHDVQLRRNNVILRGPSSSFDPCNDPLSAAKSFLANCEIGDYHLSQRDLISAFFLNQKDGRCTIRMVFNNPWTADQVLESAYKLKSGPESYRGVYLARDRTEEEMKQHRVTVSELRLRIKDHPTIRWVIQNGTIVNKGHFNNKPN